MNHRLTVKALKSLAALPTVSGFADYLTQIELVTYFYCSYVESDTVIK